MNDLWDFVNIDIQFPLDPNLAVEHNLKDMKVRCIILDGVMNHIIPHISGKDIRCQLWVALIGFYQSTNENMKMVLREKLNIIRMNRSKTVTSYLMRIQHACDELATIGETMTNSELGR